MLSRRNWVVVLVTLLLVTSLAACTSAVAVPDRDIEVSVDTALVAQEMLMSGLIMGGAELSESEFSSLLTVLLDQNSGENNPVDAIKVWFEPGNKVYAQVSLIDGVLPETFAGNSLDLEGTVDVKDGVVMLDLQAASAGGFGVGPALLAPVNAQINAALAGLGLGVPVEVTTDSGSVSIGLGG